MKYILLITLIVISLTAKAQDQSPFVKTYRFGDYTVQTGFCDYTSKIEIHYKDSLISKYCVGEGGGYSQVDTINLNNDNIPDFICSHSQEDGYFYIELMVSNNRYSYKKIDVDWEFNDPYIYQDQFSNTDYQKLVDFRLIDIDSDGKTDVLFNILDDGGKLRAIKGTDTVYHKELQAYIK